LGSSERPDFPIDREDLTFKDHEKSLSQTALNADEKVVLKEPRPLERYPPAFQRNVSVTRGRVPSANGALSKGEYLLRLSRLLDPRLS